VDVKLKSGSEVSPYYLWLYDLFELAFKAILVAVAVLLLLVVILGMA
jgi:hypothetical protein